MTPPESLTGLQQTAGQEYHFRPGSRNVDFYIRPPQAGITPETGLMLVSHNWGGTWKLTAPWCDILSDRFNLICLSVNYLQSGECEHADVPYDHGVIQAIDCLRALYETRRRLDECRISFDWRRVYACGASGGGNISLMVNKLAPASFACIIDLCGMPGLTDDIAFGRGPLNAGYSSDPNSPKYLTPAMREIRNPGLPSHLKIQHEINPDTQIVIVHGLNDPVCNPADKMRIAANMVEAGFAPVMHFLTEDDVDGSIVTDTGHTIGNRPEVIAKFAGPYLDTRSSKIRRLAAPGNFETRNTIVYPVTGGRYEISFQNTPTLQFFSE